MKFTAAAAVAGLAAVAKANYPEAGNVTYTTEVVTAFTTYCPEATTISHNGQTYTISEATTLTITNCPCTVSKPVHTSSYVSCSTCAPQYPTSSAAPVYPSSSAHSSSAAPTAYPNSTHVAPTTSVVPTKPSSYPSTLPTAGAGKAVAFSGAGLAGLLGLVAYVL